MIEVISLAVRVLGLLVTILALVATVLTLVLKAVEILEKDHHLRHKIADMLTSNELLKTYLDWLRRVLDWLDHPHRMGPLNTGLGAFQGFNVCMAMSAAYAALSLIVGWMLGGPRSVGNTHFLPLLHDGMAQFWLGAALLVLSVVVSLVLIRGKDIDATCEAWLAVRLDHFGVPAHLAIWPYRLGGAIAAALLWLTTGLYSDFSEAITAGVFVAGATGFVSAAAGTVAGAIAIALAAAGGGAVGGTVTGALLGVFTISLGGAIVLPGVGAATFAAALPPVFLVVAALILIDAGAVAVAVILSGAVAVTGVISVIVFKGDVRGAGFLAGSITGGIGAAAATAGTVTIAGLTGRLEDPFAVTLLLFPVILPVINALMDWVSWWVSRKLGRHLLAVIDRPLARGRKFLWLTGHIIVDLTVAIGLLYLLAVVLPFVIELLNLWCRSAGLAEPLPLSPFFDRMVQRPLPNGIWVLSMLFSTLVPTAIHAVILTASPFMVWLRSDEWREQVAAELRAAEPEGWALRGACGQLIRASLIGILASIAMVLAFVCAVGALWRPVGDLLLRAAYHAWMPRAKSSSGSAGSVRRRGVQITFIQNLALTYYMHNPSVA